MTNNDRMAYQAPRAVRLGDAATGAYACLDGRQGTADVCQSGGHVHGPECSRGMFVRPGKGDR